VSDQNAASGYARFDPPARGIGLLDRNLVYAESWAIGDEVERWRRGSIVCAEVLVPDRVPPDYVAGAYVPSAPCRDRLAKLGPKCSTVINSRMFFDHA